MVWSNMLFSQYYRDSTRYIGVTDFYPIDDSLILEKYGENEKHQLTFDNIFSIPEVPRVFSNFHEYYYICILIVSLNLT